MSRLKPFFGGLAPPALGGSAPMAGATGQAQAKQLQVFERDTVPQVESINFVAKESIDASSQVRQQCCEMEPVVIQNA